MIRHSQARGRFFQVLAFIGLFGLSAFFQPPRAAAEPALTRPEPPPAYIQAFRAHQTSKSRDADTRCHTLSAIFERFDIEADDGARLCPAAQIARLRQDEGAGTLFSYVSAELEKCRTDFGDTRFAGMPYLLRPYLALRLFDKNEFAFVESFLSLILPLTAKKVPLIYTLNADLQKISQNKTTLPPPFMRAEDILFAILYPNASLIRIKPWMSPYFYAYMQSEIWKVHFEYNKAIQSLVWLMDKYYFADKGAAGVGETLKDFEKKIVSSGARDALMSSPRPLLRTLGWLSRVTRAPQARRAADKYAALTDKRYPTAAAAWVRPGRFDEQFNRWQSRFAEIRRLWNQDKPKEAVAQSTALFDDIREGPMALRNQKRTMELRGEIARLAAIMSETLRDQAAARTWFEEAHTYCQYRDRECFLPYHQDRIFYHLSHGQLHAALPLIDTMIYTGRLDYYQKQVYHFWKYWISRKLDTPYEYDFPYFSIYRLYARCMHPEAYPTLPQVPISDAAVDKAQKGAESAAPKLPRESVNPPPFEAKWLRPFLGISQRRLLESMLSARAAPTSLRPILKSAANAITNRLSNNRRVALSSDEWLSLFDLLHAHEMHAHNIAMIFQILRRTPLEDVPIGYFHYYLPLAFEKEVAVASARLNIPKNLVMSIIRRESLFDPVAVSPAHAIGLMQILPTTAATVASRHRMAYKHHSRNTLSLFQPELNISIGVRYIKDLLGEFDNDIINAAAAYNAGEHRVAYWKKRFADIVDFPMLFAERIPYRETRAYVKFIMMNYLYYEALGAADPTNARADQFCAWITRVPSPILGRIKTEKNDNDSARDLSAANRESPTQ